MCKELTVRLNPIPTGQSFKSCNHAITTLRKIFENFPKFSTNNPETGEEKKTGTNFVYLSQFVQFVLEYIYSI